MSFSSILGYFGCVVLSLQMIPQILRVIKTKSAGDLSYVYLTLNIIGLQSVAIYGILESERQLYMYAGVSGMNTVILMILKNVYDDRLIKLENTESL